MADDDRDDFVRSVIIRQFIPRVVDHDNDRPRYHAHRIWRDDDDDDDRRLRRWSRDDDDDDDDD